MGVERETSTRTGSHQNPAVPQEKDHASGTEHTPRFYRRIDQLARNPQTKKKRQNKATPLRVLAVDERAKSNSEGARRTRPTSCFSPPNTATLRSASGRGFSMKRTMNWIGTESNNCVVPNDAEPGVRPNSNSEV
ncbi:hypothetical protein B296_00009187 [Ensete ventricosum]|uniref:Uncharacterized protein n=1 Tax=Ensete ventricosum TaxID=4639 RepID=A0A426ZZZ8_ENSVE|nr:hypothetical protein B296_00009187 [Ensete ventricosum]